MSRARVQRTAHPPLLAPDVAPPRLRARAVRTTAWGVVLTAAEAVIASVLAQNTITVAILQAAAVEWGTHRAGVVWSASPAPTQKAGWARRAGAGAACGVAVAVLAVAASLAAGNAVLTDGRVSVEVLAVGLGMAAVEAVRDELLLRGLVLRVTEGILPAAAGIGACAVAGACARFGADGQVTAALLFEAVRAGALAALWIYDRGAWVAVGANTGFAWTAATLAGAGVIGAKSPRPVTEGGAAIAIVTAAFLLASAAALGLPARLRRSKSVRPGRTEPSN